MPTTTSHVASQLNLKTLRANYSLDWRYAAIPEIKDNVSWNSDSVLAFEEAPVDIVVVGVIGKNRFKFGPLGDFQVQEDIGQNWDNKKTCAEAKQVLTLNRPPVATGFASDWVVAIKNLGDLQQSAVSGKAPCEHFIIKNASNNSFSLRFAFKLWEKKKVEDFSDSEMNNNTMSDDARGLIADARAKETLTENYFVPASLRNVYEDTAVNHNILLCRVLTGDFDSPEEVDPRQYISHLEDSLVEVVFSLHHFSIAGRDGKRPSNTFSAYISQIRILRKNLMSTASTGKSPVKTFGKPPVPYARMSTGGRSPAAAFRGNNVGISVEEAKQRLVDNQASGRASGSSLLEEMPISKHGDSTTIESEEGLDEHPTREAAKGVVPTTAAVKKAKDKGKGRAATPVLPVVTRGASRKRAGSPSMGDLGAGPSKKVNLDASISEEQDDSETASVSGMLT